MQNDEALGGWMGLLPISDDAGDHRFFPLCRGLHLCVYQEEKRPSRDQRGGDSS
jgi:hypothetical protein